MRTRPHSPGAVRAWRKLGWLTLLAFTIKGVATTSLILWAFISTLG